MWPLAGGVLVLGGLAPSAWLWLSGATATADIWHTAALYTAADAIFSVAAITLLWIAVNYGNTRGSVNGSHQQKPAPYPGAWVEPDGRQAVPQGFPTYLGLALVITLILPAFVLIECFLRGSAATKALATATLGPYLLVFLPQILLETRFLKRSFMTPVLPVLYAYYRLWQFVRSLALLASAQAPAAPLQGQHSWLVGYLLSLLAFWVFDSGCTMVWLPNMFEWQLQDVQLLTQLSSRQQGQDAAGATHKGRISAAHRQGQCGTEAPSATAAAVNGVVKAEGGPLSSPALAAKLRHRWRLAGSQRATGSGDYDSYSFGT